MTLYLTIALLAFFVLSAVFCGWRGSRPSNPLKGVRMTPWRPLMMVSAVGVLLMLVHLANLVGIHTGR